jgi:hypothetical protein
VTVQAPGFKKAEATSVVLGVSRDVRVNLSLQLGSVDQTVEVVAQETLVDTVDKPYRDQLHRNGGLVFWLVQAGKKRMHFAQHIRLV